jgi:hypothetical protein
MRTYQVLVSFTFGQYQAKPLFGSLRLLFFLGNKRLRAAFSLM